MFQLRYDVQHKRLSIHYTPVFNVTVDVCRFLNGTDSNPAFKFLLDTYSQTLTKRAIRPCPYIGNFSANNMTFEVNAISEKFVQGTYKSVLRFFDSEDDNLFTFLHTLEGKFITNSKKDFLRPQA